MYIQIIEKNYIDVTSLSSQRSVEQLEVSCQQVFASFGPCHVKVRYDRNKHPFAFVQFEVGFPRNPIPFSVCAD